MYLEFQIYFITRLLSYKKFKKPKTQGFKVSKKNTDYPRKLAPRLSEKTLQVENIYQKDLKFYQGFNQVPK